MARARGWCWTLNNYTEEDVARINGFEVGDDEVRQGNGGVEGAQVGAEGGGRGASWLRYICFGREVGESGTPHLQGYLYCRNACSLQSLRERIPRAHFEVSRGRPDQAIGYCEKDGDFNERGTRPVGQAQKGATEKARWDHARDAARRGDIEEIDSDIYLRYYRTLKEITKDHMAKPCDADECTGVWIYGRAGIGKSRKAREDYPDSYLKMANKWWDGYQNQDTVILDDLDTKHDCLGHHLKIWGDRYSFIAETKGGAICIRPKKLIVTSQYRIDQIWTDEETIAALKRRYKIIHMDGFDDILNEA